MMLFIDKVYKSRIRTQDPRNFINNSTDGTAWLTRLQAAIELVIEEKEQEQEEEEEEEEEG